MGDKGARLTSEATERAEALVEEWQPLGPVSTKKMFGGHGIFFDGSMFAIVDSEATVYLKADEATSQDFSSAGGTKHGRMPYWSVPAAVLEDEDALRDWAKRSAAIATG